MEDLIKWRDRKPVFQEIRKCEFCHKDYAKLKEILDNDIKQYVSFSNEHAKKHCLNYHYSFKCCNKKQKVLCEDCDIFKKEKKDDVGIFIILTNCSFCHIGVAIIKWADQYDMLNFKIMKTYKNIKNKKLKK